MIIAYVLLQMARPAKIAGISWLLFGAALLALSGRTRGLPAAARALP